VSDSLRMDLPFFFLGSFFWLCHLCLLISIKRISGILFPETEHYTAFFFPATVLFGPFLVRALVLVR
jgi:hypothetical protein